MEVKNIAPTLGEGSHTDKVFLYTEPNRPDEQMTAFEDEHGTYFMNSKDLRAVQHVERLTQMGVHSLKIEGRTKSFYYCARTAQVYRKAIDDAAAGKPFDESLMDTLESLAHRGYTEASYVAILMTNIKTTNTATRFRTANNLSANLPVNVTPKVWRKSRLKINSSWGIR
ncbi:protease [Actinobacillus pleuropneumoniae]|nr:protease [Actinobacillus pleuropneumoniae]